MLCCKHFLITRAAAQRHRSRLQFLPPVAGEVLQVPVRLCCWQWPCPTSLGHAPGFSEEDSGEWVPTPDRDPPGTLAKAKSFSLHPSAHVTECVCAFLVLPCTCLVVFTSYFTHLIVQFPGGRVVCHSGHRAGVQEMCVE